MQFFGKMSRFTHFFLGSAQTVKITLSSAFKFLSALATAAMVANTFDTRCLSHYYDKELCTENVANLYSTPV